MKRLFIDEVTNMRDLGGYTTKNGKITQYNKFIRSNFYDKLSKEKQEWLLKNKINTIIDLRNSDEVSRKKHPLNINNFSYININLVGGKAPDKKEDIPLGYMQILEDYKNMKKVFSTILNAKGGVIFNCTAGKDRTGIVSMLLLLIANVSDDDIIVDYQVSYTYIRDMVRKVHKNNPDLPAFLGGSDLECMEETLKMFYKKYKTIENYMQKIGISKNEIKIIKGRLLKDE